MSRTTAADRGVSPIKAGADCPDVPVEMPDLRENLKKLANCGKAADDCELTSPLLQWREGGGHRRLSYGMRRDF
jgi:hypothetical protein